MKAAIWTGAALAVAGWLIAPHAGAQEAPGALSVLQGRPDMPATAPAADLDVRFDNPDSGIAVSVPHGFEQFQAAQPEEIVRFFSEDGSQSLIVSRMVATRPLKVSSDDPQDKGIVQILAERLLKRDPGATILEQGTGTIDGRAVGVLTARTTQTFRPVVLQQIVLPQSEALFYVLSYTAPSGQDVPARAAFPSDDIETTAQQTMQAIAASAKLYDLSALKNEQDQRLFRTRAFYVQLESDEITQSLAPESWLRILRDGKDAGYVHTTEAVESRGEQEGVRINTYTFMTGERNSGRSETESSFWMSTDRESELWSTLTTSVVGGAVSGRSEVGQSEREKHYVKMDMAPIGDAFDPNNPPMAEVETYVLNVRDMTRQNEQDWLPVGEPIQRDLPPFYLPEALRHLLPRLLPLDQPKTYLFASFIGERREIMLRYIDVGEPKEVTLGGQTHTAVPVSDRIGTDGPATIHWVTPQGQYLGSVTPKANLTVLASDAETVRRLWEEASNAASAPTDEQPAP